MSGIPGFVLIASAIIGAACLTFALLVALDMLVGDD